MGWHTNLSIVYNFCVAAFVIMTHTRFDSLEARMGKLDRQTGLLTRFAEATVERMNAMDRAREEEEPLPPPPC